MKRILLTLALIVPLFLRAQVPPPNGHHHEIGISLGVANYWGDLQPKFWASYGYQPMVGILYKYYTSPHVGFRFGLSYTNLSAADSMSIVPTNKARNLTFATHLLELHSALEINFLPIDVFRRKATPYIFGGIGVFYFNPYAEDDGGNRHFLRPLSTEGEGLPMYPDRKQYSLVNVSFPFGGGFKFFIGRTIMLCGELGFRYTSTDYLDDVSKSYVNLDTLQAYKGKLARSMAYRGNTVAGWNGDNPNYGFQRGDAKANDWYWYGNITCTIYFRAFGNPKEYLKTKCPGFFRH